VEASKAKQSFAEAPVGIRVASSSLQVLPSDVDGSPPPVLSAEEVESRLSAATASGEAVVGDERSTEERAESKELLLDAISLLAQLEEPLAQRAGRGGIHA